MRRGWGSGRAGVRSRWTVLVTVAVVVVASQLVAAEPTTARSAAPTAPQVARVMLVGDSITHASVGDYSWRYFAWKHLAGSGPLVDFVGPSHDPHVHPGTTWTPEYADPSFDQDHAAIWGDRLALAPRHDRVALMTTFRPDVVVLELGTNDLGPLGGLTAERTLAGARDWVEQARSVVPDVDVVLVEVPVVLSPEVRRYNMLLNALASELDTEDARVVVAPASEGFEAGRGHDVVADTYDPLHPNTRGQVKLAAAVSDALAAVGVGQPYPRPLVFPEEGPRTRPELAVRAADDWALLSWTVAPGATSHDVWMRRAGGEWERVRRAQLGRQVGLPGLDACVTYDFRVRARKGWALAGEDVASPVASAVAGPSLLGKESVPELRGIAGGVKARWRPVEGACGYRVEVSYRDVRRRVVTKVKTVVKPRTAVKVPAGAATVRLLPLGARDDGTWSTPRAVDVPD